MRGDRALQRRVLGLVSLLGLADAIGVASVRGLQPAHVAHVGGFVAAALLARADEAG